jgi:hypothetical protein
VTWIKALGQTTGSNRWVKPLGQTTGSNHWVKPLGETTGSNHWVKQVRSTKLLRKLAINSYLNEVPFVAKLLVATVLGDISRGNKKLEVFLDLDTILNCKNRIVLQTHFQKEHQTELQKSKSSFKETYKSK